MKQLSIFHIPAQENQVAQVRVELTMRPGMQPTGAKVDFVFELTQNDRALIQWYLERYLLFPWSEFLTRAKSAEELIQRKGAELFEAVFGKRETQTLYDRVADDLQNTRIVIHADDPKGISLPWELMRDTNRDPYGDLAGQAYALVRSQPNLKFLPSEAKAGETFNILMVISRPGGADRDVVFQSVARPLLELFRPHRDRIRLDILRPPTFEQLARVLQNRPGFYHVLHFDGHGVFENGGGDPTQFYAREGVQGRLAFESEDGGARLVTGEEIGKLLVRRTAPIVLLNACQSGMTHPEAVYPSVGNQLLQAGASGVVAMAYSVYVQTAVRFMARLYQGLIQGEELAHAVTLAREELRSHPQRTSPIGPVDMQDWMVPILFEAGAVQATAAPQPGLRLSPSILNDEQATAGAEIGCPPPPDFGFIGRDGVTLDLERAFLTETIALLKGMAGVGKTEAAMGFARWRAETGALDGPIFFFSFEHHLPLSQVCDRVGQTFQPMIKQQLGTEWQLLNASQRRAVAVDILRQVPCFLIWDNFEPVAGFPAGTPSVWTTEEQQELRAFLQDLRGGASKVLLTSRREENWLGNLCKLVELGGLKLPEAQELAGKVLQRTLSREEIKALPDYNPLLRYLKGNPLAIQTILPELKRIQPDVLLQKLQSGEAPLSREDEQLGREHSLFASLTYRLDTIDPVMKQRLGILWLFQGFVDADVLGGMCEEQHNPPALLAGLQASDWKPILEGASELGLLRKLADGYYTVHPALPWFFQDIAQSTFAQEQEALEQAFVKVYDYYGSWLDDTFQTNTQFAMRLLQLEESNLLHALRLGQQHQLWDNLPGMLYGLNQLWTTQGRWNEWERLLAEMEGLAQDEKQEALSGREFLWRCLMGHRHKLAWYRRDLLTQEAISLRLKEHYEIVGDDHNQAVALHQLGMIAQERRDFEEAERWYRASLSIEERIGNEHGQAQTLHQLGMIAEERRDFVEAERWYRESLSIEERIGDEHGQAITLHQLGMIAQERRDFAEAERWYRASLSIKERIGNEHGQAQTLHQLGNVAYLRRDFEEAERWYRASLSITERIGNEHEQAITLHQLGMIAEERRDFEEAERWYRASLSIEERIGNEYGQASTLHQLGRIAEKQGNIDEAAEFYAEAEVIFVQMKDAHSLQIVRNSIQRLQERSSDGSAE